MSELKQKRKIRETHLSRLTLRRRQLRCNGTLQTSSGSYWCTVNNISVGGAHLSLDEPVDISGKVSLMVAGFGTFHGDIVWRDGTHCGMRFVGGQRVPMVSPMAHENWRST